MKPRKWQLTKRIQILWEPADLWIGAFWDRVGRRLFILPIPMLGIVIQFKRPAIVAPTGTLSLLQQYSSGIEPQFSREFKRTQFKLTPGSLIECTGGCGARTTAPLGCVSWKCQACVERKVGRHDTSYSYCECLSCINDRGGVARVRRY